MSTTIATQGFVPPVLVDPALDAELRTRGHVVIPFLEDAEVAHLLSAFHELRGESESGLRIDVMSRDRTLVAVIAELMAPVWERALPTVFNDYVPVSASFVVKYEGHDSAMGLHREPTYIEEEGCRAYNVWMPLVDVTLERDNGVLSLVPGSEQFPSGHTGFNTALVFRQYIDLLEEHAQPVEARAGSAVIFDSHTLHSSRANLSAEPRPVVATAVAPRRAGLVTTVAVGRRGRRVHQVDHDYFISVHPYDTPELSCELYPNYREFEECVELPPETVQAVLGLDAPPRRRTVVPSELLGDMPRGELGELDGTTHERLRSVDHDVPSDIVDRVIGLRSGCEVATEAALGRHARAARVTGVVAAVPWRRRRTRKQVGDWLGLDLMRTPGAMLLALAPGARLVVEGPGGFSLGVLDCPMVEAGVIGGTTTATLEPGLVFGFAPGTVTVWNDGTSPLVGLLMSPD